MQELNVFTVKDRIHHRYSFSCKPYKYINAHILGTEVATETIYSIMLSLAIYSSKSKINLKTDNPTILITIEKGKSNRRTKVSIRMYSIISI